MSDEILKNLTILYVEDDDIVRQNALEFLSRMAKGVYEAKDGKEAISIWKEHHIDIIIADISMPKLNGIEMAKQIRKQDKKVQIIIATAHSDTKYLLEAVELQLVKYIIKPITKQKLTDALQKSVEIIHQDTYEIHLDSTCKYDLNNKTLKNNTTEIKLTKSELLFLDLLAQNHPRTVHYEEIENAIWRDEGMSQDAIRSLVRGLRKKLPEGVIENISGMGYKLKTKI